MGKLKKAFNPMKPWEGAKPWVIDLQNHFDMAAAKEVINSKVFKDTLKGVNISSGIMGPFYLESSAREVLTMVNARACQLRTFNERGLETLTFEQFLENKNKAGVN